MDIQLPRITESKLLEIYASFGISDGKILRRHLSRFWKDCDLFLDPVIYEQRGANFVAEKNVTGRISLSVRCGENIVLPLTLNCIICGKERRLETFQKLMCSDHSRCRSCIAKEVQGDQNVRDKQKRTNIEKYGGPAPLCSSSIRKQMQNTMIERLGVPFAAQSESVKQAYRETCLERWGVTNWLASNECWSRRKFGRISKFSRDVFNLIRNIIPDETIIAEKFFRVGSSRFNVDIFFPRKKLVIECNGRYWHADPRFYDKDHRIKFPGGVIMTAQEIWDRDKIRKEKLLNSKEISDLVVIWEDDFNENKDNAVSSIKEML